MPGRAAETRGAGEWRLGFTVREDRGVARRGEPVRVGLPIPWEAEIRDVSELTLLDPNGAPVPAQFTPLVRWDAPVIAPAAPVRWLLAEFLASLGPSESRNFFLVARAAKKRAAPSPSPSVRVTETAEEVVVDTGPAQFHLPRGDFRILDRVVVDRDGDGKPETLACQGLGGIRVMPGNGKAVFHSQSVVPTTVEIRKRGPVVAEVLLAGNLPCGTGNGAFPEQLDFLDCEARIRFFAGSTRAEVDLAIEYPERASSQDAHRGGTPVMHVFEDLTFRFGFPPSKLLEVRFGRDEGVRGHVPPLSAEPVFRLDDEARVTLYQDSSGGEAWAPPKRSSAQTATSFRGYRYLGGNAAGEEKPSGGASREEPREGLRSPGWAMVRGKETDLWVGVRGFWENYPKAIRVSSRGVLEVGLFPGEWSVPHEFRGGRRKSHRLLLDVRPGGRAAEPEGLEAWLREPLSAFTDPAAYRDSFALGLVSVEDNAQFGPYETAADAVIRYRGGDARQGDIFREREAGDLYGWLHFGDHYRGGTKELRYYGNNELDFSGVMLLAYLRKERHDADYFRLGEAMALHLADIDLYHTGRDLFWANFGVRKHDASGIVDHSNAPYTSHFWIGGLTLYYLLTGDDGILSAVHDVRRWLTSLENDRKENPGRIAYGGEIRSRAWVVEALLALYELSGDERDLDFAARVVRTMIVDALPPGGFLAGSNSLVDPWQNAYVTEALGRYLAVRARRGETDEPASAALAKMLGFLRSNTWIEEAGHAAYLVDPVEKKVISAGPNVSRTQADGFTYGFLLTGNTDWLAHAARTFDAQNGLGYPYYYSTTLGTPAKSACFRLRFGQAYMAVRQLARGKEAPRGSILEVRRVPGVGPAVRYHVDRPARCRFEIRDPSGKPLRTWAESSLFPGVRLSRLPGELEAERVVVAMTPENAWGGRGETATIEIRREGGGDR